MAIAAFAGGPSIIHRCHIYSLANPNSGAIQAVGKDIQITSNIVWDCYIPFYVDTGNIINLVMEGNHFISNGWAPILTNPRPQFIGIWFHVRQDDNSGDFDGVYIDVPLRPAGETNPLYRVRLYFHRTGTAVPHDIEPEVGILVACPYTEGASKEELEGTGFGFPNFPYVGPVKDGLDQYFAAHPDMVPFLEYLRFDAYSAARLYPVTIGSIVDLITDGTGTLVRPDATSCNFTADKTTNLLTKTSGTLPTNGEFVTLSGGTLPVHGIWPPNGWSRM